MSSNHLASMLSSQLVQSIGALVFGGIALGLGMAGLAALLVFARRSAVGRGWLRHVVLVAVSAGAVLAGGLLLVVGLRRPLEVLGEVRKIAESTTYLRVTYQLQAEQAIRSLLNEPRYQDLRKLNRHEYRVFSQGGEDGLIAEIFRRIGTTNRYFVEFGSSSGFENNTVLLLRQGWSGLWIDGDTAAVAKGRAHFQPEIDAKRLTMIEAFINAENIESLFQKAQVPEEFDLLSVDIDRNDYYVWEKITHYRPRVAVVEYNPLFPPTMSWVVPYAPEKIWDGTTRTGASLKALEELGARKGYRLVGCGLTGVNAFFVREDLVGEKFAPPYTAENHYERARYYLYNYDSHHPRVP